MSVNVIHNLFEILLIIWMCCRINYLLELKILILVKLRFYTSVSRMRFIEKVIIMQTFLKNTMNLWIILSIWKKMSTRLQIEKLTRILNLTAILCCKISRELAIMIHIMKNVIMKNMITSLIEKKTFKISLQSSKQMMKKKDTSLSSVIAVRKKDITSTSALFLHQ